MKELGQTRLLVVEDNRDTLTLLRYMLQRKHELVLANTVDDALEAADEVPFHLFLLDINMGEERTGLDLLHLLREREAYATTPAVALTAYALPGDRERFLAGGFDDYLSKPFTRQALQEAVARVLERKRQDASFPVGTRAAA